jgi:transcription-repair coupling factor (superfamily II helicase)
MDGTTNDAPLAGLLPRLAADPALVAVAGARDARLAVPAAARPAVLAGLSHSAGRSPLVVAVPTVEEAERTVADLQQFLPADAVAYFPAWETLPFERVSPSTETMGLRLSAMWRLRTGDPTLRIVVATARALVQRLGPHVEDTEPVVVRPGDQVDSQDLVRRLVEAGYRREYQVEHRGEVAVRGSIVDVFPSTAEVPVRIDLWGDEVDRLCEFSVSDQRAGVDVPELIVLPARELLPTPEVQARAEELLGAEPWGREQWQRLADGETFEGMESWLAWLSPDEHVLFDLVGDDGLILLVEPRRLRDRAADIVAEEVDLATTLARTWEADQDAAPRLHVDFDRLLTHTGAPVWSVLAVADSPDTPAVAVEAWAPPGGDGAPLVSQLRSVLASGGVVAAGTETQSSAERLGSLLSGQSLLPSVVLEGGGRTDLSDGLTVLVAPLSSGCVLPGAGVGLLSEGDLTGRRRAGRPVRRARRDAQTFFEDLKVGDHVVHQVHGIARFGGMVTQTMGGIERDYLLLEYRGGDRLYVPSDQIDSVRLYSGGESPRLSKFGGADFARTKAAVRSEVAKIAQELVVLYQKRLHTQGHAFPEDTPWQAEFEAAFPFRETPDQLSAVEAIKFDMEQPVPMDRLVCGDVGFGKTEVAMRAAMKAVQDGTQVAVLVPTTLLAQQHLQTFTERFDGFPVKVAMLSRFLTAAEARAVSEGVASGEVDIIVGTHRLLSGDVKFKNLGLLVVDEEQRFGVGHKEAMKQLKSEVDVLTLTATPIPRTLEMSLNGIRDTSLLLTPPAARQPILTYVGEYDDRAVAEAIRRELLREGQVFYVHNRVKDIEEHAARLNELVPEARIAVAHGQMDEAQLERVVVDFWEGRHDVLVCTTIIESGIDMPMVNTLVVERADLLGLGQMHQLRGRVGRAGQRAYAYLFHPRDQVLTEEAYERLRTIGETTELGSGYRIAMKDLEIRGAGNLLGTGQSGHVASVGYDLYCQMVNEAINELNGVEPEEEQEITLELPLDAHLPNDYVERVDVRLEAYRRLAAVESQEDVADIESEWLDRFGPLPAPAAALLEVARLRAECVRTGITAINVTKRPGLSGGGLVANVGPVQLAASKQTRLERLWPAAVYRHDEQQLQLPVDAGDGVAASLVDALRQLVPPPVAT